MSDAGQAPDRRVVLLSGGAGNLGHEAARLFAAEAAAVVVVDSAADPGHALADELTRSGSEAMFVHADVTDAADWHRVLEETVGRFDRVDCLVNAAGLSPSAVSDDFGLDGWELLIAANLTATFLGIRAVIPAMVTQQSGCIVNVASIGGLVGLPVGHLAYAAAKGGVAALSRTTAARYGRDGIRSNTIFPGVLPPMRSRSSAPSAGSSAAAVVSRSALGRQGAPLDVAHAVVFLGSEKAAYITGADLVVDGGAISVAGLPATPSG